MNHQIYIPEQGFWLFHFNGRFVFNLSLVSLIRSSFSKMAIKAVRVGFFVLSADNMFELNWIVVYV